MKQCIPQVLEQIEEMFELDVAGGFNLHDVDEDVAQSDVAFLEFEVALVELPEVLLVHVANAWVAFGGTWVKAWVLLI